MQRAGCIDRIRWIYTSSKQPLQASLAGACRKNIIVLILNKKMVMEQIIEKNVRFCGCCHRELPVDSFYVDKRTLAPDNYCKECRRAMSNARYRRSLPASNPLRYPVITEISDCTLRMYLILNALKVVRESVLRKRKRLCEAGDIE